MYVVWGRRILKIFKYCESKSISFTDLGIVCIKSDVVSRVKISKDVGAVICRKDLARSKGH